MKNPTSHRAQPVAAQYTREFTAYAKSQGRTPAEQLEHDKRAFPGGCMCGFICWCSKVLTAFKKAHPEAFIGHCIADHDAKQRFMEAQ